MAQKKVKKVVKLIRTEKEYKLIKNDGLYLFHAVKKVCIEKSCYTPKVVKKVARKLKANNILIESMVESASVYNQLEAYDNKIANIFDKSINSSQKAKKIASYIARVVFDNKGFNTDKTRMIIEEYFNDMYIDIEKDVTRKIGIWLSLLKIEKDLLKTC